MKTRTFAWKIQDTEIRFMFLRPAKSSKLKNMVFNFLDYFRTEISINSAN